MNRPRLTPRRLIGGAVVAAVVVAGSAYAAAAGGSGGDIAASYAFDPEDKPKMMDFSDEVFVGRVVEKVRTIEDEAHTVWAVDVLDSIKGDRLGGRVQVEQLGYVDERGHVHQISDSPILEAGREYLLLTTHRPDGSLYLLSSPNGSPRADTAAQKARLMREDREAAKVDSGLITPPRT